MRRTSIKCGESALEGIIGQYDDRRKVDAVKHPHYKAVGFLKPKIANINWCGGTAFLIGPITIVTAAHNLFLAKGI
jgi:V8-like Glu-specific endopeptidase